MVKYLDDVLSDEDTAKVEEWQREITDLGSIAIIEKPKHIEIFSSKKGVETTSFTSLRNIYARALGHKHKRGYHAVLDRLRRSEKRLLERRSVHSDCKGRRHEILYDEMHIRSEDIRIHKGIVEKEEGYDFGLFIFPHWLRYVSKDFYELSDEQNEELDLDFEWAGLEKAIVVMWPTAVSHNYCVFVGRGDLLLEENLAQFAGGVGRDDKNGSHYEKCEVAREQLERLEESEHFVILEDAA